MRASIEAFALSRAVVDIVIIAAAVAIMMSLSIRLEIPLPKPIIIREPCISDGAKVKRYTEMDKSLVIPTEFQKLNSQGYTHVVNMPGDMREIFYYAKRMKIVVLDHRISKYVSDLCSRDE